MTFPEELARSLVDDVGSKVVLVTGAGCSFEPPTSLPLAGDLAAECHRKLVAAHVLEEDAVEDSRDLSALADAVFERHGSQQLLVNRFPITRMRTAPPNSGHLVAAALFKEGVLTSIITLNFDHAFSAALAFIGVDNVETIYGPHDFSRVSAHNLVYLHRDASAPVDEWILRTDHLDREWVDSWQEVLVRSLLAAPVIVFAGMGSAAAVLVDSVTRIRRAIGDGVHVCLVDPSDPDRSDFHREIAPDSHLQMGWVEFATAVAEHVALEQVDRLKRSCAELEVRERWGPSDVSNELRSLLESGLVAIGAIRAQWLLDSAPYRDDKLPAAREWIADLLLAIGLIAEATGTVASFHEDGTVEFRDGRIVRGLAAFAHGQGSMRWLGLDSRLLPREKARPSNRHPNIIIVSGVLGPRIEPSAPADITGETDDDDIVASAIPPLILTVDEVRQDPTRVLGD